MEYLSLSKKTFNSDNISRFENLVKLKKIHLIRENYKDYDYNNYIVLDALIYTLAMKDHLESIELVNIPISDSVINSFANFQKLKELIIHDKDITDEIACRIGSSMPELTHLTFSRSKITNTGIINLIKLCPTLGVCKIV